MSKILAPMFDRSHAVPQVSVQDDDAELKPSTRMLLAMSRLGKPVYGGTVPAPVVARRRAANKAARKARRASR